MMDFTQRVGMAAYNAVNGFRQFDRSKEDIQTYLDAKMACIGRAAISAMREPSEEMEKAGYEDGPVLFSERSPRQTWLVMIDAALQK